MDEFCVLFTSNYYPLVITYIYNGRTDINSMYKNWFNNPHNLARSCKKTPPRTGGNNKMWTVFEYPCYFSSIHINGLCPYKWSMSI